MPCRYNYIAFISLVKRKYRPLVPFIYLGSNLFKVWHIVIHVCTLESDPPKEDTIEQIYNPSIMDTLQGPNYIQFEPLKSGQLLQNGRPQHIIVPLYIAHYIKRNWACLGQPFCPLYCTSLFRG